MIEEFSKYKYIKKTKSELESERIIQDISNKLWNENGYTTIYNLGALSILRGIAEGIGKYGYVTRQDILKIIKQYKDTEGVADLADMILKEFDDEEK